MICHSPAEGHLGAFQFLSILNKAAGAFGCVSLDADTLSLSKYLVALLSQMSVF